MEKFMEFLRNTWNFIFKRVTKKYFCPKIMNMAADFGCVFNPLVFDSHPMLGTSGKFRPLFGVFRFVNLYVEKVNVIKCRSYVPALYKYLSDSKWMFNGNKKKVEKMMEMEWNQFQNFRLSDQQKLAKTVK